MKCHFSFNWPSTKPEREGTGHLKVSSRIRDTASGPHDVAHNWPKTCFSTQYTCHVQTGFMKLSGPGWLSCAPLLDFSWLLRIPSSWVWLLSIDVFWTFCNWWQEAREIIQCTEDSIPVIRQQGGKIQKNILMLRLAGVCYWWLSKETVKDFQLDLSD